MRISILFARFGPYHHARLRAVGKHCDLTAIEFSAVDKTYAWSAVDGSAGFRRVTLFADNGYEEKLPDEIRNALWQALDDAKPEAVAIPGWAETPALLALAWCRQRHVPSILMSDSQVIDEPRFWWKEWVKARVVKQYSAGFVAGSRHKDYLETLGLPSSRITTGYDVVDNEYFRNGAAHARGNVLTRRKDLALPERYFLTSCRFVEKKNLHGLLTAYAQYCKHARNSAWHLVIIGDGPLRPQLETQISELHLSYQVHLPGFKQYNELPDYYGLASVYIQSSTTEQWGLVVNEAMASGLPVLVSDRCGCAPDLVQGGANGYTFDPLDVERLADLMVKITADQAKLDRMGQESQKIISNWTPETFAENLLKAAEYAIRHPLPRASWLDRAILKGLIYR